MRALRVAALLAVALACVAASAAPDMPAGERQGWGWSPPPPPPAGWRLNSRRTAGQTSSSIPTFSVQLPPHPAARNLLGIMSDKADLLAGEWGGGARAPPGRRRSRPSSCRRGGGGPPGGRFAIAACLLSTLCPGTSPAIQGPLLSLLPKHFRCCAEHLKGEKGDQGPPGVQGAHPGAGQAVAAPAPLARRGRAPKGVCQQPLTGHTCCHPRLQACLARWVLGMCHKPAKAVMGRDGRGQAGNAGAALHAAPAPGDLLTSACFPIALRSGPAGVPGPQVSFLQVAPAAAQCCRCPCMLQCPLSATLQAAL